MMIKRLIKIARWKQQVIEEEKSNENRKIENRKIEDIHRHM